MDGNPWFFAFLRLRTHKKLSDKEFFGGIFAGIFDYNGAYFMLLQLLQVQLLALPRIFMLGLTSVCVFLFSALALAISSGYSFGAVGLLLASFYLFGNARAWICSAVTIC